MAMRCPPNTRAFQENSHMAMRCPHYAFSIYINFIFELSIYIYAMLNVVEKQI